MIEVAVVARRQEAEAIVSFELARPEGGLLPPFRPGAHVDVRLPNGQLRQYSLCGDQGQGDRYLIAVLRAAQSRGGSQFLHERVGEGDRFWISEPRNLFPLAENARRSLLFAGGIGITPILSMAEHLAGIGADFELHYSARSAAEAAFLSRIGDSSYRNRVFLHFSEGPSAQRLDAAGVLGAPTEETDVYVCGPNRFMDHVLGTAAFLGWPAGRLHREYFADAPMVAPGEGFEVEIASSGLLVSIPPDKSVAEALEERGVVIPLACGQGICGTCLTGVLEGEPDHRDLFLSDEERARNDQFTPCCSRAKSPRLRLDL
jgi:vanillate O-demethylase ferredoxin subunit